MRDSLVLLTLTLTAASVPRLVAKLRTKDAPLNWIQMLGTLPMKQESSAVTRTLDEHCW